MSEAQGSRTIELDRDLPEHCDYVDALLARSLRKGKCSRLLRNQLVAFSANIRMGGEAGTDWFDPNGVCQAMAVLEGITRGDITKGPSTFTKGPLRGLEYKHFFQASFMAQNLLNESERDKEAAIYRKFAKHYGSANAMNGKPLAGVDLNLIVDAVVTDAYERRAAQRAKGPRWGLTGEHLIFARLRGGNRYLFVAPHTATADQLAEAARACLAEFPEMQTIASSI